MSECTDTTIARLVGEIDELKAQLASIRNELERARWERDTATATARGDW